MNECCEAKRVNRGSVPLKQGEVLIGYIQGVTDQGKPEVSFHFNQVVYAYVALTTIPVSMDLLGRNVVLSFVEGDLSQPIVMGLLWQPETETSEINTQEAKANPKDQETDKTDPLGDVQVIRAKDRIEIKCGQASITLTHTGKILLRGEYISSRSTGAHRIKGGSVQVN